jgi:patatin-like phospholipase/acyl hydrolase
MAFVTSRCIRRSKDLDKNWQEANLRRQAPDETPPSHNSGPRTAPGKFNGGQAKSIKVLSIDGGGIRGIIPAILLAELQKRLEKNLHEVFDLIAGTSTGGIIALGIGTRANNGQPYSPDELLNLYVQNGAAIFQKHWYTGLRELFRSKYSPRGLEETLERYFRDTEFKTALTPLLISSYDLHAQRPFFFKSHVIATHTNWNWPVTAVARATSAAPTFLPPLHLARGHEDYALVDGGVYVNNPAMAAFAEARRIYPEFQRFVVVAVGTGDRQDRIAYAQARRWGLLGWASQIVPVFMDSVSEAVDFELEHMPGCSYRRLQVLGLQVPNADMDNVTPANIEKLQEIAREFVKSKSDELDKLCAELKEGRGSDMPGTGR